MRYRTRPVVIEVEARQFTDEKAAEDLAEWCGDTGAYTGTAHGHTTPPWQMHTCITPEVILGSKSHADVGDWIVMHVEGMFKVLSDEEFTAKYEATGDAHPEAFRERGGR